MHRHFRKKATTPQDAQDTSAERKFVVSDWSAKLTSAKAVGPLLVRRYDARADYRALSLMRFSLLIELKMDAAMHTQGVTLVADWPGPASPAGRSLRCPAGLLGQFTIRLRQCRVRLIRRVAPKGTSWNATSSRSVVPSFRMLWTWPASSTRPVPAACR